ncbi:MAG: acyltransferase family protein [Qipengyuania sp.]
MTTTIHRERFVVLDSLRGIVACLVVLYHCPDSGLIAANPFVLNSWVFVEFFFGLSGFVISSAYFDKLGQGYSLRRFMLLRLGRLFPLHAFLAALGIASFKGKVFLLLPAAIVLTLWLLLPLPLGTYGFGPGSALGFALGMLCWAVMGRPGGPTHRGGSPLWTLAALLHRWVERPARLWSRATVDCAAARAEAIAPTF